MDNIQWAKVLTKEIIEQNITKALNSLGIEGTLEAIEHIQNPVLRSRLRVEALHRIIKGG